MIRWTARINPRSQNEAVLMVCVGRADGQSDEVRRHHQHNLMTASKEDKAAKEFGVPTDENGIGELEEVHKENV